MYNGQQQLAAVFPQLQNIKVQYTSVALSLDLVSLHGLCGAEAREDLELLKSPSVLQVFQGTGGSWDVEPGSTLGSPRDETAQWALPAGHFNAAMQNPYGYGR
jgi:hypothetical protein